ncbi:uncharacterized protein N0V89_001493 [Didymosphaeria variabile]|uniref:Uncharacterized protein n=1 Tax=Didymosphaeria variabile TaxID=1932322 RepID=A0A9W8XWD4_9PLEO|nr:uncharacterized protein N0V89_001493 [Didymosphaeria variabile]KAJ4360924.1 hypothetical protein N0V89_001493 [Didymosphaeria variabile]
MSQTPALNSNKKGQHLSVDFEKLPRGRASSVSAQTIVAENPEFEARKAAIKRRQTHVAVVEVSWWQCFKAALFGPKNLKRELAATVEIAEVEDTHAEYFDERDNWYTLTVSAYKRDGGSFAPARCVLDTGNTQGNFISMDLARRLGFAESDIQPLTPREGNGGMVATGEVHKVLGFVRVSWFSQTSPRVFNQMRFLVSETAPVDLVIGTRSIQKEKLLNPPNLMNADNKFVVVDKDDDPISESLVSNIAKLETVVLQAETVIKDTKEGTKERVAADKALKKAKKELKRANLKKALNDVKLGLKKQNTERTQRALMEKKKGLEAKLEGKKKKES